MTTNAVMETLPMFMNDDSARPCGCDPGEHHLCDWHGNELARQVIQESMGHTVLPVNDAARKALPIWDGVLMYFPAALLEVARVSRVGNDQHNPNQPLHWAREKSTDQMNTALRHMMDHGTGNLRDTDGTYHLAKAIWRLCAELQLTIERSA
jgi:hypothetical protein